MKKTVTARWVLGTLALCFAGVTSAQTRVLVAHLAPFADTPEGTSVNILVDGTEVLTGVQFGEFSDYLTIEGGAGTYTIDVLPTGDVNPAITETVTLADDTDYTAAAIGDGTNQVLDLLLLEDDNSAPAAGQVKVRVVHAAPFADTTDGTRVSIRTASGDVVGGLSDVPYPVASEYLQLPEGTYDLKVTSVDGSTNLIDPLPVDLSAGAILTLFAVGDGVNQPLGILALPVGLLELRTPIDLSLNGSWFNDGTDGQGFSFEVIPAQNRLVAYWFTFDANGTQRVWFTADTLQEGGSFDGRNATLVVFETTGGAFDQGTEVTTSSVGTLEVEFTSCTTATATYDLNDSASGMLMGTFTLTRLSPVVSCTLSFDES